MRLLQYIVFFILVLNGLQPFIAEQQAIADETLTLPQELCSTADQTVEGEQKEDDNIESQGDEDLVTSDDSQVVEPKPNDLETSAKGWCGAPEYLNTISPALLDWKIKAEHTLAKIPLAIKKHTYFSKRTSDLAIA